LIYWLSVLMENLKDRFKTPNEISLPTINFVNLTHETVSYLITSFEKHSYK
jgi:hypothetical protein